MKLNEIKCIAEDWNDRSKPPENIHDWMHVCGFTDLGYTVKDDKIFPHGEFDITTNELFKGKLPFKLGNIPKDFIINCGLGSNRFLDKFNGPEKVFGSLYVDKFMGENFKDGPTEVQGYFSIEQICTNLNSLVGLPKIIMGDIIIKATDQLKSFEGLTPKIGGALYLHQTGITSLEGISDILEYVNDDITLDWSKIQRGGLGLLAIKGLRGLTNIGTGPWRPFIIINKYLDEANDSDRMAGTRDIFGCQRQLIEEGFEEFAVM